MATYECSKCGMGVNATCAKCDAPLIDDILELVNNIFDCVPTVKLT